MTHGQTHRQTDRQTQTDFIICPIAICYSYGADNYNLRQEMHIDHVIVNCTTLCVSVLNKNYNEPVIVWYMPFHPSRPFDCHRLLHILKVHMISCIYVT